MEFISSTQHDKYKEILDKIDEEYKKHEELQKRVENENNKLIAVRVATENLLTKKIFHVLVKVYSSIFDLSYIYSDRISQDELKSLLEYPNAKLYVIELLVSNTLLQRLNKQRLLLHVNVQNSSLNVHKTVVYKKSRPFVVVVPFDKSIEDAVVKASLYTNQDTTWCCLYSSSTTVDISYHFGDQRSLQDYVIKLAQQYQPEVKHRFVDKLIEYKFKCECSTKHFFESLVKNCYHRVKPESFAAFSNRDSVCVSTKFVVDGGGEVAITLDRMQSVLSVSCNVYDLVRVKKYFVEEIRCREATVEKMWLVAFINLKRYLRAELGERLIQCKDVLIVYEELRKLIYELSV
ncbi:hypothetical protein RN001_014396 [Aquatica leii]|uniref:Uncharacterized protein n=1 Tax=Aquatica leii TaxID=1421715 RepID=A0AAN7NXS8_9COLE|nr:hypothetical protein RN001_014396 [Aquatica leii]